MAEDDARLIESTAQNRDRRGSLEAPPPPGSDAAVDLEDARVLVQMAKEQLAREIDDIERAAAVLRRVEPALQSWSRPATPVAPKPRPLWLVIGALWLSTAIVTACAAFTIASLAG